MLLLNMLFHRAISNSARRAKNLGLALAFLPCLALAQTQTSFTKITTGPLVNDQSVTPGSAWGDYDNDGDLDVFLTVERSSPDNPRSDNLLYENDGQGQFQRVTSVPGGLVNEGTASSTACWIDFDNDGDLDLFVAVAAGGSKNFLYINNGDKTFTPFSGGPPVEPQTYSKSGSWADFDNDGWVDLLVANDGLSVIQKNFLYFNEGNGTFTKVERGQSIVEERSRSQFCACGDLDNDGFMDVYVSNVAVSNFLYRNAGQRKFNWLRTTVIGQDNKFPSRDSDWVDFDNDLDLDLFAGGQWNHPHRLFINNGDGTFRKLENNPLLGLGESEGGAAWGDFDNDGDLDVFIGNNEENHLFENNGQGLTAAPGVEGAAQAGGFTKVTTGPIATDEVCEAGGAAWVDIDSDGDLDLFVPVKSRSLKNFLYLNNGNSNHWINIQCVGVRCNRSAIGTRVYATASIRGQTVNQMREIHTTAPGAEPLDVHIGLGDAAMIEILKVVWPASKTTQLFTNVPANQFVIIREDRNEILPAKHTK